MAATRSWPRRTIFPTASTAWASNSRSTPHTASPGLSGYKRLLDAKPDAVVIESPPYFHPEQAMAGAEAGCHVYVAKPIAVDVPGCLTIAEAGKKATENKKCFLVDFQTRTSEFYREAIRRVHAGDIGPLVSGEAVYYCGTTWGGDEALRRTPRSRRIGSAAWGLDRVLSGDIITEQNIHALDVATWIVDQDPVKAYGTCGREGRVDHGDCNGHFSVIYIFPNNVVVTFASKQYGTGYDDIGNKMFGPKGTLETHYAGQVIIRGEKSYKGGRQPGPVSPTARWSTSPTSTPTSSRATAPMPPWPPACAAT